MIKRIFISFVLCISVSTISLFAQDDALSLPFQTATAKIKLGKVKAQKLKGKINGMGILLLKDKSMYFGDFKDNEVTGYGMMIAPESACLKNVDGCRYYVGNFEKGLKTGHGVCYSDSGIIIYSGRFENDKPQGEYPGVCTASEVDSGGIRMFTEANLDDFYYVGEFKESVPDGMGVMIFPDGDVIISNYKSGQRKGIGLYLAQNGEWETQSCKSDGELVTISSSEYYAGLDAERKAANKAALSTAFSNFGEAARIARKM